jgi:NifU-like protein
LKWLDRLLNSGTDDTVSAVIGDPALVHEVESVLAELRPMFRADAGDIELVSIVDGYVHVRLAGACKTCHASDQTLFAALEPRLRERCAWVRGLRAG